MSAKRQSVELAGNRRQPGCGERHIVVPKPWGRFQQFGPRVPCTVKLIEVLAGEAISLQYHEHRDELWVVLDPGLRLTVGQDSWIASTDEMAFISRGTVHRVENTGTGHVSRVLEISYGDFDEQDVVRLDDRYGRPAKGRGHRARSREQSA